MRLGRTAFLIVGLAASLVACSPLQAAPAVNAAPEAQAAAQAAVEQSGPAAPPDASQPRAPDLVWGVNGHPFTAYPGIPIESQLDALQKLGATQYRVNLAVDGSVSQLERLLAIAGPRGVTILPVIAVDASLEKDAPEVIYQRAYDIARMLAKTFAGRISVWELGNELENFAIILPCEMRDDGTKYPCEWGPAGGIGALEYYGPRWKKVSAMLRGMSDGVRAGDPRALRAAGTSGWGHSGAFDRMLQDGVGWEISVWHSYALDQEPQILHVASLGKPIWITEFNHPEGSTGGEDAQADRAVKLMQHFRQLRVRARVEAAFIYELLDEPYWQGTEAVMGLIHLNKDKSGHWMLGEPKRAFTDIQTTISSGNNSGWR